MKGKTVTYFILSFLVILILSLSNCGGSSDNGAIPDVAPPQQNQNLVNKEISGYVYHISSLSSSETEEEEEDFSILEVPITGEDGFIAQVNEYFQTEPSSRADSSEKDELLNAFTEEASCYVPLNSWNSGATLFSVYSDSENSSSIPVGAEGEISSSVPVDAGDDFVSLEIGSSEGEYYEAETISTSDIMGADESGINLKSCPKKILIKPGECEIFKVFSKPSVNLYDAGLQFSLANPEYGCIAGPIFIKCKGSKQTGVAYGILYAKKNLDTPLDTVINVTTAGGQSLNIPVQIVKKTAVVSGRVYAGGPIVKGHVVSQGPKSQCKINEDGTYSLPKVWQGSGRKITATWWIMSGNQKVRYRETKYVDVFGDVTVDFGLVQPSPTPTVPPLGDPYYNNIAGQIIEQKIVWQEELGIEQGLLKTVDWINGILTEPPIPSEISENIEEASIDEYNSCRVLLQLKNGLKIAINDRPIVDFQNENETSRNEFLSDMPLCLDENKQVTLPSPGTVKNKKVLMLGPAAYDLDYDRNEIFGYLVDDFREHGFDVNIVALLDHTVLPTGQPTPGTHYDGDVIFYHPKMDPISLVDYWWLLVCQVNSGSVENLPRPGDFEGIDQYGVIYIMTHGAKDGLMGCPLYVEEDGNIERELFEWWVMHGDFSMLEYQSAIGLFDPPPNPITEPYNFWSYYQIIVLSPEFFNKKGFNFNESLVYVHACYSYTFQTLHNPFPQAKVFVGHEISPHPYKGQTLPYYFFEYMLGNGVDSPLSAREAYQKLLDSEIKNQGLKIYTGANNENDNTYLPGNVEITIQK